MVVLLAGVYLSCAELWDSERQEWIVSHYLFRMA